MVKRIITTLAFFFFGVAFAENITIITQSPVGSSGDIMSRYLADRISKKTSHTVIVKNTADAIGSIVLRDVHERENALLLGNPTMSVMYAKEDTAAMARNLKVVHAGVRVIYEIYVPSASPITSVADLASASKKKPVICSMSGQNAVPVMDAFGKEFGVAYEPVLYRDRNQQAIDIINGLVDCTISGPFTAGIGVGLSSGKLRSIHDFSKSSGDFVWNAVFASPKISAPLLAELEGAIASIMSDQEYVDLVRRLHLLPENLTKQQIVDRMVRESAYYK